MLCISGFVDDVMFSCYKPSGACRYRSNVTDVMHGLTPLLHGIDCVLS